MSVYSDTHIGQVVRLRVEGDQVRVSHVYCAVDCGFALNPDGLRAQIESGIIFGLSGVLHGEIRFERGRVVQTNFTDYPILQLAETPAIEVEVVESDGALSGVGEIGAHPIMAATCNAIFDACGHRIRELPVRLAQRT